MRLPDEVNSARLQWASMKTLPVLAFVLVIPLNLLVASDKPKQDGKELVEQAEAKTNIFALPSFQMKATVQVESNGKMLNGSYLLLWNGPAQWREEISFPGYSETQVGGKGVIFLKRSMDVIPLRINQLHSALGYGSGTPHGASFVHVTPGPDETVKKIHNRKNKWIKSTLR